MRQACPADLEDCFKKKASRRVALDCTVSLAGRLYKTPEPLIDKQIILLYHDHNPDRVEVLLGTRSHGLLRPLNLAVNCKVKLDHHLLRWKSSSTAAPTGGSLFSQNQTRRSATHETKLPRRLCPHQGILRL
ncbi:hypothetical protein DFAR_2150001 [Desulfarculales bacterium]